MSGPRAHRREATDAEYDVVVVGAGGSGLATAASALERGASVVALEKRPDVGGTTAIAVGTITANRTSIQARAGVEDSVEAHAEDAAKFAAPEIEALGDAELRRWFLEHAREAVEWLRGMGVVFFGPNPEPPNRVPRMHNAVPGGRAIVAALERRVEKLGGRIVRGATVEELLRDATGRVVGVRARLGPDGPQADEDRTATFRARRGVVLAGGDYSNAPDLIARFKGERFRTIEGINPHATGECHRLAESVGARLVNMEATYGPELRFVPPPRRDPLVALVGSRAGAALAKRFMAWAPPALVRAYVKRLLVTWQHPENALFDDGAILVNARGERFCDECAWPEREIAVSRQPDKVAWLLLDAPLREKYSAWPHFVSTAPEIAYAYARDYLRLRPDVAVEGATPAAVAAARGIPPEALARTVEACGRASSHSEAVPPPPRALGPGPWMLLGPAKAYFTTTEGGVAIDRRLRVLNEAGEPIEGLRAVGTAGIGGMILWGHGLHIGWAIASGLMAGRFLAEDAET